VDVLEDQSGAEARFPTAEFVHSSEMMVFGRVKAAIRPVGLFPCNHLPVTLSLKAKKPLT